MSKNRTYQTLLKFQSKASAYWPTLMLVTKARAYHTSLNIFELGQTSLMFVIKVPAHMHTT